MTNLNKLLSHFRLLLEEHLLRKKEVLVQIQANYNKNSKNKYLRDSQLNLTKLNEKKFSFRLLRIFSFGL